MGGNPESQLQGGQLEEMRNYKGQRLRGAQENEKKEETVPKNLRLIRLRGTSRITGRAVSEY